MDGIVGEKVEVTEKEIEVSDDETVEVQDFLSPWGKTSIAPEGISYTGPWKIKTFVKKNRPNFWKKCLKKLYSSPSVQKRGQNLYKENKWFSKIVKIQKFVKKNRLHLYV